MGPNLHHTSPSDETSDSKDTPWPCSWAVGDVIGLAANLDLGKIAVSKNGSWEDPPGAAFRFFCFFLLLLLFFFRRPSAR